MKRKAFTFVEILVAIILVGIAIASLVAGSRTFTRITGTAAELSTAEFLAEQIRELTMLLPVIDPQTGTDTFGPEPDEATLIDYDDLDDFDGSEFSPPISADANRTDLNDLSAYTQQITVENVNPSNFEYVIDDHTSSFVRVTVKVLLKSEEITSASWIRAQY